MYRDATGQGVPASYAILPLVQLGEFDAVAVPSLRMDTMAETPGENKYRNYNNYVHHTPLLGCDIFKNAVLTIDYAQSELRIYKPQYNPISDPVRRPSTEDLVLDFEMAANDPTHTFGVPVVRVQIDGKPARAIVDTGLSAETIGLSPGFTTELRRDAQRRGKPYTTSAVTVNAAGGTTTVEHIPSVTLRLPAVPPVTSGSVGATGKDHQPLLVQTPAILGYRLINGTDAVIGTMALLSRFERVTFDFPRRKILLEKRRPVDIHLKPVTNAPPPPPGKAPPGFIYVYTGDYKNGQWKLKPVEGKL